MTTTARITMTTSTTATATRTTASGSNNKDDDSDNDNGRRRCTTAAAAAAAAAEVWGGWHCVQATPGPHPASRKPLGRMPALTCCHHLSHYRRQRRPSRPSTSPGRRASALPLLRDQRPAAAFWRWRCRLSSCGCCFWILAPCPALHASTRLDCSGWQCWHRSCRRRPRPLHRRGGGTLGVPSARRRVSPALPSRRCHRRSAVPPPPLADDGAGIWPSSSGRSRARSRSLARASPKVRRHRQHESIRRQRECSRCSREHEVKRATTRCLGHTRTFYQPTCTAHRGGVHTPKWRQNCWSGTAVRAAWQNGHSRFSLPAPSTAAAAAAVAAADTVSCLLEEEWRPRKIPPPRPACGAADDPPGGVAAEFALALRLPHPVPPSSCTPRADPVDPSVEPPSMLVSIPLDPALPLILALL